VKQRHPPTWAQIASQPPSQQENIPFPSLIDSLKSIISTLNLHKICNTAAGSQLPNG
jgi:hypothetical protein